MDWLASMLGAVALLIWGLRMVRTSVERMFPEIINHKIIPLAGRRTASAMIGTMAGAFMQSSTATISLAAGLADRGKLLLPAAIAISFGADLGSAIATVILSIDIGPIAPLLIFVGVLVFMTSSSRQARSAGRGLLGLGLVFLALLLIGRNATELRSSAIAITVVEALARDLPLALLLGALITTMFFSSIAVVLFLVQLALQDIITFETGLFALIGVNVGAGFLPVLACLGLTGPGARVVQVNLIARLVFAAIAVSSVLVLGPSFFALTPNAGISLLWFHVGLNFTLAAALVHVTPAILNAAARIFPSIQREPDPRMALRAIYLNENDLKRPDRALLNITRELLRAADTVHEMLTQSIDAFQNGNLIAKIRESDEIVDSLHRDITVYISRLMREQLSDAQAGRARALFDFSTNLEHIGDIIDHNLMELARSKKSLGVEFSDEGWHELSNLHSMLIDNYRLSLDVVMSGDIETAEQLLSEKRRFRNKAIKSQTKHFKRLLEGRSDSLGSSVLHLDVLRDLRRVSSHLTAAAYPVLDTGRGSR